MAAIDTRGAGDGFLQGFSTADQYFANQEARQQRRQALQTAEEQRSFENHRAIQSDTRADQALSLSQQNAADMRDWRQSQEQHQQSSDARADRQLAISERTARMQQILGDIDVRNRQRVELRDRALQSAAIAQNGGEPFPLDLHDELVKGGMPALSPYSFMDPGFVRTQERLKPILDAIHSGNLKDVNSPKALDALNHVYSDQVSKGVGEFFAPMGGNVASKRITKLEAGPGGSVIANIRVNLDNGRTYDAPLTVARSSDPEDPVRTSDPGAMIDDVMGRYQLSQVAKTPEFQKATRAMFDAASSRMMNANGAKPLPADAQMIEYLTAHNVPFEKARDMVLNSADNPEKAARDFAGVILKSQAESGGSLTPEQALAEARRILATPQNIGASPAGTAAPSAGQQDQAESVAPPPQDSRKVGQTYQTPRGPAVWRGNGWELVNAATQ